MNAQQRNIEELYLFLSSKDSTNIYPQNNCCHMKIDLPEPLKLMTEGEHGCYWTVALTDITITDTGTLPEVVIVTTNIIQDSLIRNRTRPVLRVIAKNSIDKASLYTPYYHRVNTHEINTVEISLRDLSLEQIDSVNSADVLTCTLHFQLNQRLQE